MNFLLQFGEATTPAHERLAIGEQRHRADGQRYAELDPEIGKVQESHAGDDPAQALIYFAEGRAHACERYIKVLVSEVTYRRYPAGGMTSPLRRPRRETPRGQPVCRATARRTEHAGPTQELPFPL
jgi:hypothetical protein